MIKEELNFSQRYAEGNIPWDSGKPSKELVRVLNEGQLSGNTALEIGCGTGTNAIELARRGFKVTAVDYVPQAIEAARTKASAANVEVEFRVADVLNAELGGPYDILFDRGVYHVLRMEHLEKFQQALRRVTRRGTRYLCLAGNAKRSTWKRARRSLRRRRFALNRVRCSRSSSCESSGFQQLSQIFARSPGPS